MIRWFMWFYLCHFSLRCFQALGLGFMIFVLCFNWWFLWSAKL